MGQGEGVAKAQWRGGEIYFSTFNSPIEQGLYFGVIKKKGYCGDSHKNGLFYVVHEYFKIIFWSVEF